MLLHAFLLHIARLLHRANGVAIARRSPPRLWASPERNYPSHLRVEIAPSQQNVQHGVWERL